MLRKLLERFGVVNKNGWWNEKQSDWRATFPAGIIEEFEETANRHKTTVDEVLRTYMKLGVLCEYMDRRGTSLYIQNEDGEFVPLDVYSFDDEEDL